MGSPLQRRSKTLPQRSRRNAAKDAKKGPVAAVFVRLNRRGGGATLFRDAVLFVLRTEDAVDGIGGAVAGFVEVTDLHLA